jgi:hypothetical protein
MKPTSYGAPHCAVFSSGGRWEDNIKMDITEMGIDVVNCIRLTQDRFQWRAFVNTVMNLRVQQRKQDIF